MNPEDSTVSVTIDDEGDFLKSSLEFVLSEPGGQQRRYPLQRTLMRLDFGEPFPDLSFRWLKGVLLFTNLRKSSSLLHRRQVSWGGEIQVGDVLSWGPGFSLRLFDRSGQSRATLECYSDPFYARIWPIDRSFSRIGRAGRRDNEVELAHPTISREHATLAWDGPGPSLICDSSKAVVVVDGEKLEGGQRRHLQDGALVQLGGLLFHFRLLSQVADAPPPLHKLYLQTLGSFQVRIGEQFLAEKVWRTQSMRWLLARLGLEWGRAVPLESLLSEFWPDKPESSARNNLNFNLSQLRSLIRANSQVTEPFLRSTGTVQLNPDLLGENDLIRLRLLLAQAEQVDREGGPQAPLLYEQAFELYRGPYLPGCYLEWACLQRDRIETEVLQAGRQALKIFWGQRLHSQIQSLAAKLLALDPCCAQTHTILLSSHLETHCPSEAIRIYKLYCKNMQEQLELPPDPQISALYEQALQG